MPHFSASSAELRLPSSALNSGGSLLPMSRKELTKNLYRTVAKASGPGRSQEFPRIISNAYANSYYSSSSDEAAPYPRRYGTLGGSRAPGTGSPLPLPSLKSDLVKQERERLEQQRLASQNGNGVSAREKAQRATTRSTATPNLRPLGSSPAAFPLANGRSNGNSGNGTPSFAAANPPVPSNGAAVSASNGTPSWAPSAQQPTAASPSPTFTAAPTSSAAPSTSSSMHTSSAASSTAAMASIEEEEFEIDVSDEVVAEIYKNEPPPDVHIVNTVEEAKRVAQLLAAPEMKAKIFACDTEVMDIELTRHSPCCHGTVICFSVYCGPDVDFSDQPAAPGGSLRSMLWVDTYLDGDESRSADVQAIIDAFKPFFESSEYRKVWHNYSFDRHVMERLGVDMKGFDGDTMHMARLWDSSRIGKGGYSLEALSSDEHLMGPTAQGDIRGKVSMKKLFGRRNIKKDGTEGKLTVLPPVHELQRGEDTKWRWVNYSAYDAKSTWDLYVALSQKLQQESTVLDGAVSAAYARSGIEINTLWDLYRTVWRPFGGLLTDMESAGMAVDRAHLAEAEKLAVKEEEEAKARFKNWASSKVPDAKYMNVGSSAQVSQLLFGGTPNKFDKKEGVPKERTFKVPNQLPPEEGKKPKKNMDITLHNVWDKERESPLKPEIFTPSGLPACSTPVLKSLAGKPGRARKALAELGIDESTASDSGLEVVRDDFDDAEDVWSTDDKEIEKLQAKRFEASRELAPEERAELANRNGYGKLFQHFRTQSEGLAACAAVDSLVDASAIDTLLSNFIVPLQSDDISKPDASGVYRVHCSLNINTETGRLSARRPNLQNQPALEKDRYKVRKAFTADRAAGKTLIVADYGQLELRILAHMAKCESMLTAFKLGGDFHSRTALGMYDHIKEAIEKGDCLLEWDGGNADGGWTPPPVPLLKDMFASERRKAKVLNFSIAYGKTAHGLSKDWGVSLSEAEDTVRKWYGDRKEVEAWQKLQRESAMYKGYVCTILGRRRQLPDANSKNNAARQHALRAAINTPIQGSAADVATAAMLRIDADQRLKDMGWKLLLQVHDEVILEGPKESAEAARAVVVECMRSPFGDAGGDPLLVELAVDSKYADTWYDAK